MAVYSKICVPVDNSPTDRVILDHVKPLARLTGASLVLVHVADGFVARNQERLNLADSPEIRADREYLAKLEAEFQAEGFTVSTALELGEPAPQILAVVAREGCDLIAMATHGHKFIADMLLGSVAENLRHRTDVPILMVRAPKP